MFLSHLGHPLEVPSLCETSTLKLNGLVIFQFLFSLRENESIINFSFFENAQLEVQ